MQKNKLENIQKSDIRQTENNKRVWENVQKQLNLSGKEPPVPCYEHTTVVTKGPLMNSAWDQLLGYNDQLPFITCNGGQFQVFAGCVPIAMAQVMRYHQHPAGYNWGGMPLTGNGNAAIALFIEDIHDAIDNVYSGQPLYSCTATGVYDSKNMGTVLKNEFSYSSAFKAGYNYATVKSNINYNRPVILDGSGSSGGHMWVADGFRETTYHFDDCTGVTTLTFHMNWGWHGTNNGWFAFDNFNPGNFNFNNSRDMHYNIIP